MGTEPNEACSSDQSRKHMSDKINNVILDYNPKYKINIHKSIVI